MEALGKILRKHRRASDISQKDLAHAIGRHQWDISYWEKGTIRIPAEEIPAIARVLGVPVQQLFTSVMLTPETEEEPAHVA